MNSSGDERAIKRKPETHKLKRYGAKYKQGSFSNFCGLYAIINAYRELLGKDFEKEEIAKAIFKEMLRYVEAEFGAYATLKKGTTFKQLQSLSKVARRRIDSMQLRSRIDKPERLHFDKPERLRFGKNVKLEDVLSKLRTKLCTECVALVGFEGSEDHWVVATEFVPDPETEADFLIVRDSNSAIVRDSNSATKGNPEEFQIGTKKELKDAREEKRADRPLFIMPKQIILLRVT